VQGRSAINTGLVMLPLAFGLVIGSGLSHKVTLKLGRRTRTASVRYAVPPFVGSYLAVWALVGLPVYALYRPQGTAVAGTLTIVAGTTSSRRSSATAGGAAARASARECGSGSLGSARASA
jgi:hypothetical protein